MHAPMLRFAASLAFSAVLVVPLFVLEWWNRREFHEEFPLVLFTFMSVHSLLIVLSAAPAVGRLRSARDLRALTFGHWAGLALSVSLAFVYAGVVIDQLPCFLGVPNCD
jgi:hypothetical protein